MYKHLPYIHAAFGIAAQSVGKRRKTGAVIVRQGRIISHGLNHAPKPFPPELEDENFATHPWVVHAECHALLKLTQFNPSLPKKAIWLADATIYCTDLPCFECATEIVQARIKHVVYVRPYRRTDGLEKLKNSGVLVTQVPMDVYKEYFNAVRESLDAEVAT